jgi:hypothetical protein
MMNKQYAFKANEGRKMMVFELGDWILVHMRKKRFPTQKRFKLISRGHRPFQIIEKINDNAYKVELISEYDISATFNVSELSLFDVGDNFRVNHFEERGNDVIPSSTPRDPLEVL